MCRRRSLIVQFLGAKKINCCEKMFSLTSKTEDEMSQLSQTDLFSQKNENILEKIENCLIFFQKSLNDYPRPTLYVAGLDESHALEIGAYTHYRFACIFTILVDVYKLIQTNTTRTKRSIFYDHKQTFVTSSALDLTLNHICRLLHETRKNLHIMTTGKGLVMGDLSFTLNDCVDVTCSFMPAPVPPNVDDIVEFRTNAKFVLVVEKDSIFQKLVAEDFCAVYDPCILVTAKGYPDFATRMFLLKLDEMFHLPLFALMDGDPHGIEIYLTYKYGSSAKLKNINSDNSKLSTLRWIGVFSSEISGLPINSSKYLQMTSLEKRRIELMLNRNLVQEDKFLTEQLEKMLKLDIKIEVEAICSLGDGYLTSTYLKLKFQKLMKNLLPN